MGKRGQNNRDGSASRQKQRIRIVWTCSDYVYHEHRYKWTAWVCGVMQNVVHSFRERT